MTTREPPAAALTTIWTAPCGIDRWYQDAHGSEVPKSCQPPNFSAYWSNVADVGYYSPAICPSGFTLGSERWDSVQGPELLPEETAWMCAQSGYTCNIEYPYAATLSVDPGSMTRTYAPLIQIRWQSSDLSILETPPWAATDPGSPGITGSRTSGITTSEPSSPSNTGTGTGTGTGTNTGTHDSGVATSATSGARTSNSGAPEAGSSPLSTGVQAGIGVGIALVLLLICGGAVFSIRRYRASRLIPAGDSGEEGHHGPGELSGESKAVIELESNGQPAGDVHPVTYHVHHPHEIDSSPRDNPSPLELPALSPATASGPPPPEVPPQPAQPSPGVSPDNHSPNRSQGPVPEYSSLPEVVEPRPDAAALEALRARATELERERQRILRLEEIEAEQARLRRQISEYSSVPGRSPSGY